MACLPPPISANLYFFLRPARPLVQDASYAPHFYAVWQIVSAIKIQAACVLDLNLRHHTITRRRDTAYLLKNIQVHVRYYVVQLTEFYKILIKIGWMGLYYQWPLYWLRMNL